MDGAPLHGPPALLYSIDTGVELYRALELHGRIRKVGHRSGLTRGRFGRSDIDFGWTEINQLKHTIKAIEPPLAPPQR